ncbi:50S ribosomal protein L7ae-like protein [Iocasia frigidifontis]|uniref:50S ribosomal protein L7ae-like protein n=2 Tax=Halanaerobiaceae TaxID=972 RepID=A0A8A7KBY4_9FIRM|nr:ribosomal L7Ae/L30e/S12e/Gadd45 family protein [Iocasia fonsfrigidae]AZO96552.1 50S ribosomal protein L7ae-like protein [Halocella sp. SP3-1]MTI60585.1 50S ribosomal protein L7ae-like protein [Bacillota bacterium]QTL99306.1 50S ribosomal protein L7ae-like protein [Iocasia fonsfrigidae]
MVLTELAKQKNKVVGTKQTLHVINNGKAAKIFIAEDIDKHIKTKLIEASRKNNLSVEKVESKLKLGRACGIDVSAACAALLK